MRRRFNEAGRLIENSMLLAVFGLSAMTIVPGLGDEMSRGQMRLVAWAFAVAWLCLAFWARARQRAAAQPPPPQWLRRLWAGLGVVYLFGGFALSVNDSGEGGGVGARGPGFRERR
jgi:drug/metabolite transporter (DMT)-like permease